MWLYNIIDAAVYPQLVIEYVRKVFALGAWGEAGLSLGMVALVTAVSLLGVQWIERSQSLMFVLTMVPCVLFIGYGLPHLQPSHLGEATGDVDWSLVAPPRLEP